MSRVWSWRQAIWESNLGATTKIVLQALASHLNDMGEPMFPSQARLSRMCSLSERAVITHLHIAEQSGWIAPRKRDLKGSKWAANEYAATWPDGVNDVQPSGEPRSCHGVNDVHTNSPMITSIEKKRGKKSKPISSVLALKPVAPSDGIALSSILKNGEPPDDWVKMAQAMHRLTEASAWKQARKCVWYYTEGPGKVVRRREDQWSSMFLRFYVPRKQAA